MSDDNTYLPRCKVCGPLSQPTSLERAIQKCDLHRQKKPNHSPVWVRIKTKPTNTTRRAS